MNMLGQFAFSCDVAGVVARQYIVPKLIAETISLLLESCCEELFCHIASLVISSPLYVLLRSRSLASAFRQTCSLRFLLLGCPDAAADRQSHLLQL